MLEEYMKPSSSLNILESGISGHLPTEHAPRGYGERGKEN